MSDTCTEEMDKATTDLDPAMTQYDQHRSMTSHYFHYVRCYSKRVNVWKGTLPRHLSHYKKIKKIKTHTSPPITINITLKPNSGKKIYNFPTSLYPNLLAVPFALHGEVRYTHRVSPIPGPHLHLFFLVRTTSPSQYQ